VNVLVDTTVWSLALRRARKSSAELAITRSLEDVVRDGRALLVGLVRQELLSGVSGADRFRKLERAMAAFPDEPVTPGDHVAAARAFNACRARGIQGTTVDLLLCAVAMRIDARIFSLDRDFEHYARALPIVLHRP